MLSKAMIAVGKQPFLRIGELFFEPVVGVGLVVEGGNLLVAGGSVQADRFD
jgi:hypothetical protein